VVLCISLGAALLYALATVLQHRAARQAPSSAALRLRLLASLGRRPLWLAGLVADAGAFGLQALALERGSLAVVQPLLVTGLLFALPLGAAWTGLRMTAREWMAALATVIGLAAFLEVASPATGTADLGGAAWLAVALAALVPAAMLVAVARPSRRQGTRAALLGAASGMVYAFSAALTKTTATVAASGPIHLLGAWQTYALAATAVGGMVLVQSCFQAGPLSSSLPVLTIVEPLASVAIGALAFGEHIVTGGLAPLVELASVAAMVYGVVTLARFEAGEGDPQQLSTGSDRA
jgi:drug/metabolite transporter (DMT)-like permease